MTTHKIRLFRLKSTHGTRALQVYLILIGLAVNRQSITYGGLAKRMKYGKGGNLAEILGHIMFWCYERDLPPLTALVVNMETGEAGPGLATVQRKGHYNEDLEDVFNASWFSWFPPTVGELTSAFVAAKEREKKKKVRAKRVKPKIQHKIVQRKTASPSKAIRVRG